MHLVHNTNDLILTANKCHKTCRDYIYKHLYTSLGQLHMLLSNFQLNEVFHYPMYDVKK